MSTPITSFDGEYRYLSNFYKAPIVFIGATYPSAEHLYQACKCAEYNDGWAMHGVTMTSGDAKRMGQKVKMIPDWDMLKVSVMATVVLLKFTQNPDLKLALLATGDRVLIEGNTWHDNFWGVCSCDKCKEMHEGLETEYNNWLGKILMGVRGQLAEQQEMNE